MINFLKRLYFSYQMEKLYRSLEKKDLKGMTDMDCEHDVEFYHMANDGDSIDLKAVSGEVQDGIAYRNIVYGYDILLLQWPYNIYASERKMKPHVIEDLLAARYMWDLF